MCNQKKILCSLNSKNNCYICRKPQSKLSHHLKTHMDEVEVGQALSLPVHSKEHKAMLQKLRNKGNYQHNTDVLQCGEGALKIKWAPERRMFIWTFTKLRVFCPLGIVLVRVIGPLASMVLQPEPGS